MKYLRLLCAQAAFCACLAAAFPGHAYAGDFGGYMRQYETSRSYSEQLKLLDAALSAWTYDDGEFEKGNAYLKRGNLFLLIGNGQKAVEDLTSAINLVPGEKGIYINRGHAYKRLGDYNSAMRDYNVAMKDPAFVPLALCGIGDIFVFRGDFVKAIKYYDEAAKARPGDMSPVFNKGVAYYLMGRYDSALAQSDKALAIAPDSPLRFAFYNLSGYANFNKGRYASSLALFKKTLKLNPNYWEAMIGAGLAHSALSETEQANDYLRQAEKMKPELAKGVKTLDKYFKTGDFRLLSDKVKKEFDTMHLLLHYAK